MKRLKRLQGLCKEPEPFGKFIDNGNTGQTEVHKGFCGIGVGTALLKYLTKLARRLGYEAVDFGGSEYETPFLTSSIDPIAILTVNIAGKATGIAPNNSTNIKGNISNKFISVFLLKLRK